MIANVVLYGCLEYFYKKSFDEREKLRAAISENFAVHIKKIVTGIKFGPEVNIDVNLEKMPIKRTQIAEIFLDLDTGQRPTSQTLHKLAAALGDSWTEYVRSFIDSGALVAIRVTDNKTQVTWSPHGRKG